jgi:Xaa-Pro aminopeptidase
VRKYDEDAARAQSVITEVVTYTQQGEFARAWAGVLRSFGLERGRVGLELGCWNLAPADVSALQAELPDLEIVDATRLLASVAAVKTERELETMRQSMSLTDVAIHTFQRSLREGVTESEVSEAIDRAVKSAGGAIRPYTLVFGARSRLPHGNPAANPLSKNEPAFTEVAGVKHGYAAGLCRSAVLGRHHGAESLHSLAEEALEAGLAAMKPGVTAGEVDAAVRGVIERAGKRDVFRHRAGYQTGINWTERGNLSLEPNATDVLEPNMTYHLPIILFQAGEYGLGCSENVVVTATGVEVLSKTPHTLYRA